MKKGKRATMKSRREREQSDYEDYEEEDVTTDYEDDCEVQIKLQS